MGDDRRGGVLAVRTVIDIALGNADQELAFDCPEGRPSSVDEVRLCVWSDADVADIAGVLTASIEDDPDTTVASDAGAGQADRRLVELDDVTGIAVNRTYLLQAAGGHRELVEVDELDITGKTVRSTVPLHNVYADGDTFQSTRIVLAVDDTWAADETNIVDDAGANPMYRVRLVYTVASKQYVTDLYFNLVRYPGRHAVRPQDVELLVPGWMNRLPIAHKEDQGAGLIDDAYREVKMDLHGVNFDDSTLAESEVVDELVRYKTIELSEFARFLEGTVPEDRFRAAELRYSTRKNSLVVLVANSPKREVDGSASIQAPPGRLTVR
jgi:hypothetical protein